MRMIYGVYCIICSITSAIAATDLPPKVYQQQALRYLRCVSERDFDAFSLDEMQLQMFLEARRDTAAQLLNNKHCVSDQADKELKKAVNTYPFNVDEIEGRPNARAEFYFPCMAYQHASAILKHTLACYTDKYGILDFEREYNRHIQYVSPDEFRRRVQTHFTVGEVYKLKLNASKHFAEAILRELRGKEKQFEFDYARLCTL